MDSQPQTIPVRSSCSDRCQKLLWACNSPGLSQGRTGHFYRREGGAPGWVVLWSLQHSEKLATAQDKHKQGHPLGRLTPCACVGACQSRLWHGSLRMAGEHLGRHPKSASSSQWKVLHQPAQNPLRLREGNDSPDSPLPQLM